MKLLKFWAQWCAPCVPMSKNIEELKKQYSDLNIISVNIDEDVNSAVQYNVMALPTIVLLKDEKEVDRSVGLLSVEKLIEFVERNR